MGEGRRYSWGTFAPVSEGRQCSLLASFIFAVVSCMAGFANSSFGSETIVIPLTESVKRDPVVQWIGPRREAAVKFTGEGIVIDQTPEDTNIVGVKSRFSIAGNFDIEFECVIRKLEAPRKGDRQGLTIRFLFDGPDEKMLTMGYVASAKEEKGFYINPGGVLGQKILRHPFPEVRNIRYRLQRIGNEIQYTITPDSNSPITGSVKVLPGDVHDFAVFATRQESGNTNGSYVIKKLQVTADKFPAYARNAKPSTISWWTIFIVGQALVLATLLVVVIRRQQGKSG